MLLPAKVSALMAKGVKLTNPLAVEVGEEVSLERISSCNVVIHGGVRIRGADTLISAGAKIGSEGPATVIDCQLGPQVELKGGFFEASVFLDKVTLAYGAHVREGSLLEEEAKAGHAVGLKQTILFPFVTLGSLINFCDCLMAGGTGRDNHSEVGSSYIHFNYTPQQDKATPSQIGDVPRGVMLDQPPIFLGGQGGLVGPLKIDYGTVITAGTIWRHDSEGAKLLHGGGARMLTQDYQAGLYGDIRKKVNSNILYIAGLRALREWYDQVRRPFFEGREMGAALLAGSLALLDGALSERLKRCRAFAEKMSGSAAAGEAKVGHTTEIFRRQREFRDKWPEIEAYLLSPEESEAISRQRDVFREKFLKQTAGETNYITAIKSLDGTTKLAGTMWLQQIIDEVAARTVQMLPSFRTHLT